MEHSHPATRISLPGARMSVEPRPKPLPAEPDQRKANLGVTVRLLGSKNTSPDCFRTHKRHLCDENDCRWRYECRRLIAEWRR